jgi:hypothetical protein
MRIRIVSKSSSSKASEQFEKKNEKHTKNKLKNYAETYFFFCFVLLFNIEQLKFHEKSGIHIIDGRKL